MGPPIMARLAKLVNPLGCRPSRPLSVDGCLGYLIV